MMKSFKALVFFSLLVGATAKVDFEDIFDDFPGFRYTEWSALPNSMRDLATTAGYTAQSWDEVGTAPVEDKSWDDLNYEARSALYQMGFRESTWDCYVNHYSSYSWTDLVEEDLTDAAKMLGYTPQLWDNDGTVDTDRDDWMELTDAEQWAAAEGFCYFADTWDKVPVPNMDDIPTIYPWFRYVLWDDLPASQRSLADKAGWSQEDWDVPDSARLEYTAFSELDDPQREALLEMGFYEEQYDCFINHYYGYSWEDLVKWDIAQYYEAFGWTPDLYTSGNGPTAWTSYGWDQLSDDQRDAAKELCWFKEIWREEKIAAWGDPLRFPTVRFTQWSDLSSRQQNLAATAGWDRASWDTPGTADLEDKVFDDLTEGQQNSIRALGFYSVDQYDCYVNHYEGLDWADLADYGILQSVQKLGWTQDSWDNNKNPPASDDKAWDDLSDSEKEAADDLCWFAETWDKSSLTVWEGVAWPEARYWTWDGLDRDEKELLTSVGWNKSTWDNPGKADFEYNTWDGLSTSQQDALEEYGFYEAQWNCYMAHYEDYDWFELVMEGVAEHFETLGWSSLTWKTSDKPWAWNADWDELDDAEKDAAWELCYFREIWDEIPLQNWPRDTVSGGPMYSRSRDEGGGRPGLWISFLLLLVAIGGGVYYYKTHKEGKEFDPTTPTKKAPNMSDISLETAEEDSTRDIPTIT